MVRSLIGASVALTLIPAGLSAQDEGEFGLMHVAAGAEDTFYTCTACHSERVIVQQGQPREGWEDILGEMIEDHGMQEPDPELREAILAYLTENYNIDRPYFPFD